MKDKIKNGIKAVLRQLKDKTNIIIFIIVFFVVSCEVWVPYIIGIITGNAWWFGIGSACWAFWLAPFTPFIPICLALTFLVRKIIDKVRKKTILSFLGK